MEPYSPLRSSLGTSRKLEVLVADDEPEIREVLDFGLQQEGFFVRLAADGLDALHVYHGHCATIDVVLLDVRMPCLDGPAALVAMQELKPQVRCCFMSGDVGQYTEERLRAFGARAVIKKPFQMREVARLLRDAVEIVEISPVRTAAEQRTYYATRPTNGAPRRDAH